MGGRWRERKANSDSESQVDADLAIQLAPHLESLARTVTPRGGIGRIKLSTKDQHGNQLDFQVDHQSRGKVLEYAENTPPREIDIVGEVRSIDLDMRKIVILHPLTGERFEAEFYDTHVDIESLLRQAVYVRGRVRPLISSRNTVKKQVEVISINRLTEVQRRQL